MRVPVCLLSVGVCSCSFPIGTKLQEGDNLEALRFSLLIDGLSFSANRTLQEYIKIENFLQECIEIKKSQTDRLRKNNFRMLLREFGQKSFGQTRYKNISMVSKYMLKFTLILP